MARVKQDDDPVVDFLVSSGCAVPPGVFAIYCDEDGQYEELPVLLWGFGELMLRSGKKVAGKVRGLVSGHGGLELVEDNTDDMEFIGYWRKDAQTWEQFLEDHEIDEPPEDEDDDDD